MRKLSIIHIVYSLGVGGIENAVARLALDQTKRGADVTVVCLFELGSLGAKLRDEGIEVIVLNLRCGLGMFNLILPLRKICAERKTDVIHVHVLGIDLPMALFLLGKRIKRRLLTIHVHSHYSGWRYWRARAAAAVSNIVYNKICAISQSIKDHEVNYMRRSIGKIIVISNGVSTSQFCPKSVDPQCRAQALGLESIDEGAFVIGMGVQLKKFKDIPALMRAAQRVKAETDEKCYLSSLEADLLKMN